MLLDDTLIAGLIFQLSTGHSGLRETTRHDILAIGPRAVPLLIRILRETSLPHRCGPHGDRLAEEIIGLLRAFSDVAIGPLAQALAEAVAADRRRHQAVDPTWPVGKSFGHEAHDVKHAFNSLEVSDVALYLPLLTHPDTHVRGSALGALHRRSAEARPYAGRVVTILDHPSADVCDTAGKVLKAMGPEIIPTLRDMVRTPGGHRRATHALAVVAGWDTLETDEQATLQRLIGERIAEETLEPIGSWNSIGEWFAVSTGDHKALMEVFGCVDAMPATMRLGWSFYHDSPGDTQLYLTPELDGWVLVFGPSLSGSSPEDLRPFLCDLSRRFGSAHWYSSDQCYEAWAFSEHGELIRVYMTSDYAEDDIFLGPPHPAEEGQYPRKPDQDESESDYDESESDHSDESPYIDVFDIAERASINPLQVGPHTRVHGHAWIAVTKGEAIPTGVFSI